MAEESDYEVEAIRKWRYNLRTRRKEFFIKWVGYAEEENTWEPEDNLNCPHHLKKFLKLLKGKERMYYDSRHPERLTGLQRNAEIIGMTGRFERARPSTSSNQTNSRPRVVIFVTFEDDEDVSEKVDIDELREARPDMAFEFLEQRLIDKAVMR